MPSVEMTKGVSIARPRAQKHRNASSDTTAGVGTRVRRAPGRIEAVATCSLGELVVDDADEPAPAAGLSPAW